MVGDCLLHLCLLIFCFDKFVHGCEFIGVIVRQRFGFFSKFSDIFFDCDEVRLHVGYLSGLLTRIF